MEDRADYADNDYIGELLVWTHPHLASSENTPFSEDENLVMLRLPKKECEFAFRMYTVSDLLH